MLRYRTKCGKNASTADNQQGKENVMAGVEQHIEQELNGDEFEGMAVVMPHHVTGIEIHDDITGNLIKQPNGSWIAQCASCDFTSNIWYEAD